MSNVIEFPKSEAPEFLIGPFEIYNVVVEGRLIPLLTGRKGEKTTWLYLDHRFGIEVPNERAYDIAWLVAQALAIGQGYTSLNAEEKGRPFANKVMQLASPTTPDTGAE